MLSAGGFHSVPVVDHDNNLVGIVTTTDLIGHMLEGADDEALPPEVEERLRVLERVLKAVQSYLHSGQAMIEHERLEKVLEEARRKAA